MTTLTPMTYDETHSECVERAQRSLRYELRPEPLDHDYHVTAWRIHMWDTIEELAWLRRQTKDLYDGH